MTLSQPSTTSTESLNMPQLMKPSSQVQPSRSSLKLQQHPLFGLWNPIYQGWLISDLKEVFADSSIWTKEYNDAQKFRTEAAALTAGKHLRDYYGINVVVSVMEFADG